jgi:hypothetical protein
MLCVYTLRSPPLPRLQRQASVLCLMTHTLESVVVLVTRVGIRTSLGSSIHRAMTR